MKKIALFKAKQKDDIIKIIEGKPNTFVSIGKKILKLPFNFENTISYLRKLEII
ncbi:hypothetical protein [Fusobacterium necrophorum]|uniref:hypothetical protein n=1 Tax=Fusobacterium necrophorum TaxID=859 RepID=UPI00164D681F|nr:hypothetical protein [Fusobacterium necrophorum]